jgi:hypothetical protein
MMVVYDTLESSVTKLPFGGKIRKWVLETKRPPAKSWWVQKLSADFTAD